MTAAAARQHPWRNVVTRALSGGTDPDIDTIEIAPEPGERYLLCSDGLSGVVPHDAIARILGGTRRTLDGDLRAAGRGRQRRRRARQHHRAGARSRRSDVP